MREALSLTLTSSVIYQEQRACERSRQGQRAHIHQTEKQPQQLGTGDLRSTNQRKKCKHQRSLLRNIGIHFCLFQAVLVFVVALENEHGVVRLHSTATFTPESACLRIPQHACIPSPWLQSYWVQYTLAMRQCSARAGFCFRFIQSRWVRVRSFFLERKSYAGLRHHGCVSYFSNAVAGVSVACITAASLQFFAPGGTAGARTRHARLNYAGFAALCAGMTAILANKVVYNKSMIPHSWHAWAGVAASVVVSLCAQD